MEHAILNRKEKKFFENTMKILLITVFNILEDDEVRQSIKIYSSWPTFPQLYIKSDLIGGLDIVKELVETSEFQELFLD